MELILAVADCTDHRDCVSPPGGKSDGQTDTAGSHSQAGGDGRCHDLYGVGCIQLRDRRMSHCRRWNLSELAQSPDEPWKTLAPYLRP